jgi:carboxymethylenebutenolidase
MTYNGMLAENIMLAGDGGDEIECYYARPLGPGPSPGVVVIHHMPGWDEWTFEVVRRLAHHGYAAISPHLFHRFNTTGSYDDAAARARAEGGMYDSQVMGDVAGCMSYLRSQVYANGKIGIIGFCSGGRHVVLAASQLDGVDAAVDCWGGGVIVADPSALTPQRPVAVIDLTERLNAPLLGIFGNEDANPTPEQVDQHEETLKRFGKNCEFHRYDGAGHAFFDWNRGSRYRADQAVDAWGKVCAFYERYLSSADVPQGAAVS